ncbi:MAG TPA: phosphatase PAP2 family protein [Phycisphaerae bacterium]|nr:phosphatase PAP2 family protein [Phycisphaerae bacterium]
MQPFITNKPNGTRPGTGFGRIFIWLTVPAMFLLLVRFDVAAMLLRYEIVGDRPEGLFKQFLGSVRELGQLMAAVVAMCIVASIDRRRWAIILTLLLAELISSVCCNAGKLTIVRYRPYAAIDHFKTPADADRRAVLARMRPGDSWVGWRAPDNLNKSSATQSFPSGHSAAGFVLAAVLASFYPRLAWLLWTLAVCCSLSRYIDAVHWLSDCWVGSLIGYASAWMALKLHASFQRPASMDNAETVIGEKPPGNEMQRSEIVHNRPGADSIIESAGGIR